jgi:hypothetical protein
MRERATILDGSLEVNTRVGAGTTVELSVPLPSGAVEPEGIAIAAAEPVG